MKQLTDSTSKNPFKSSDYNDWFTRVLKTTDALDDFLKSSEYLNLPSIDKANFLEAAHWWLPRKIGEQEERFHHLKHIINNAALNRFLSNTETLKNYLRSKGYKDFSLIQKIDLFNELIGVLQRTDSQTMFYNNSYHESLYIIGGKIYDLLLDDDFINYLDTESHNALSTANQIQFFDEIKASIQFVFQVEAIKAKGTGGMDVETIEALDLKALSLRKEEVTLRLLKVLNVVLETTPALSEKHTTYLTNRIITESNSYLSKEFLVHAFLQSSQYTDLSSSAKEEYLTNSINFINNYVNSGGVSQEEFLGNPVGLLKQTRMEIRYLNFIGFFKHNANTEASNTLGFNDSSNKEDTANSPSSNGLLLNYQAIVHEFAADGRNALSQMNNEEDKEWLENMKSFLN